MIIVDLGPFGEAVRTRWVDTDFDNGMWNIPPKFMKMKRPHKVLFSKEAILILGNMRSIGLRCEGCYPV